jgi:lysophospholipid acyltransferase (LPLAT)-like uncharacterized protein
LLVGLALSLIAGLQAQPTSLMKSRFKRIRDKILLFLASWIGPVIIYLLGKTLRVDRVGEENLVSIQKKHKNVIYAFWHGRMLILAYSHRWQKIHILISQHRDGEFIARIIHRLGFVSVRGSTTRGGSKAIFEMCEKVASGYDVGVTPDGPKGPRFKVQPGTIYMAQRSGLPIIPITASAKKRWTLSTWDGFIIPKPFSRAAVMLGEPTYVPSESSPEELEKIRIDFERKMQELTAKADNYFSPEH